MQPLFFVCHSAAFNAYELGISDNITEFIKFIRYIFLLPFAKLFCLFCHFVLPYGYNNFIRLSTYFEPIFILYHINDKIRTCKR
jgi:hypothetical protein